MRESEKERNTREKCFCRVTSLVYLTDWKIKLKTSEAALKKKKSGMTNQSWSSFRQQK